VAIDAGLLGESVGTRSENVDQLVDHLFRQEFGRMVSRLARILGAPRLAIAVGLALRSFDEQ